MPVLRLRRRFCRRTRRLTFAALAAPVIALGVVAGVFYLNLHRGAAAMSSATLPQSPLPIAGRRLLVIAPHCDDETLGVGGIIHAARRQGIPVTVAFLTNGDGFRFAASVAMREVNPSANDLVRFGEFRQKEALSALHELGVDDKDVVFLGYPDQGLKALWEQNWKAESAYHSPFTNSSRAPYTRNFTPHAAYCGESLTNDLARLMQRVRPTDIYVTHPSDDHRDHSVAPAFARAALDSCRRDRAGWASSAAMHYYIIHRGDWPLPQGFHPDEDLVPPAGLTALDTHWSVVELQRSDRNAKRRALARYGSQLELTGRFLQSFVRRNELFGTLPDSIVGGATAIASIRDASGDDLVRFANPSADLTGLSVRDLGDALEVSIDARGPATRGVGYSILARSEAIDPNTGAATTAFAQATPPGSASPLAGRRLSCRIPLSSLGIDPRVGGSVFISAETRVASRLEVDRTGYRVIQIPPTINPSTPSAPSPNPAISKAAH